MRIKTISAQDIEPIRFIEISDLSDVVVFAGPNGVGKTRFVKWLLQLFQNLNPRPNQWLQIECTSPDERSAWGKPILDTRQASDVQKLRQTLQRAGDDRSTKAACSISKAIAP
jgi:predicted ATPase